jgi:Fe-S-cluster containining protein
MTVGDKDDVVTQVDTGDVREESVCIGCGLCCDGTVVTHLAVRDESDLGMPLRALGVEVLAAADPPVFTLPCPALSAGRCTIHHLHRPNACHAFECAISTAVENGSMTHSDARSIIGATSELQARVRAGEVESAVLERHLDAIFRT